MAGKGKPFVLGKSGNPIGSPVGARNKTTLAVEALFDGEAEALTRKAVEMAKAGNMTAMRLCLDRIVPARKDRPFNFALPPTEQAGLKLSRVWGFLVRGHCHIGQQYAIFEPIWRGDECPKALKWRCHVGEFYLSIEPVCRRPSASAVRRIHRPVRHDSYVEGNLKDGRQ